MSRRFGSMLQFARTRRVQTLLDQGLVSACNFATGIVLVRGLGLVAFGQFTVAYVILLLANSVQLSFISSPMITLGALCPTDEERRTFVRGMYGVQMVFCAVASLLAAAGTAIYFALNHDAVTIAFLTPFTFAVVAFLMQDWLRRYYFTVGKAAASFWNDVVSYLGQAIVLCVLWALHWLTINSTLWTMAITSGVAFAMGALTDRLGTTGAEAREAWRRSHAISIDLGISNQLQWFVYQGAMLVGASLVGAQAAGGVRATQNIIGPVNIAYQAMENIVPVKAAEEMRRGGIKRASAFLFRFGVKGFIALLIFFSAAALFSQQFLSFIYGKQLHAYAAVLDLQMLYFLLAWPIRQVSFLFRTIKQTRPILIASMIAAALSMAMVYASVHRYGTLGIMLAAVTGQIGNLVYLFVAWWRRPAEAEPALQAQPNPE